MNPRGRRTTFGCLGNCDLVMRMLRVLVALVAISPICGPAAGANAGAGDELATEATALDGSPVGATEEHAPGSLLGTWGDLPSGWLASVRTSIGQEMGEGQAETWATGAIPSGLPPDPDWTASGESDGDYFGRSVASAGDVNGDGYADAIVGASDYGGAQGKAYVFYGSATGLSAAPDWTASGENDGDWFGGSVASAGDVNGDGYADLVVGASRYGTDQGKAYVFHGSATGLSAAPDWTASGENDLDRFGGSVASAGDVNGDGYADLVVGARGYYVSQVGKAYVFFGSATGLSAAPDWTASGENGGDHFGGPVASAGDVDGDGYADLVVGAGRYGPHQGKAYVFHGSATGLPPDPDWTASGENDGDYFGGSVASAGDVDGDGYADLVVGADGYGVSERGKAYVFFGSATGLSAAPGWAASGENYWDHFPDSVASAGDLNGDGYADVVVGAAYYGSDQGKAYVFHGSATGLSAAPDWTASGENDDDRFGGSVASAGDVNGDGYADLVVGASGYGVSQGGKAYVYHGAADGLSYNSDWSRTGENMGDAFGILVANAGDVNGDGYTDVAVGANGYSGGSQRGRVYVYHGSATGLSTFPDWTATGEKDGDEFGLSVAAGDVNGDGYADLVVGAGGYRFGSERGKVYLYYGAATGLSASPGWTASGEDVGDRFGASVAGAGDVNGDGYADLIVGAEGHPSGFLGGRVYVYHGAPTGPGPSHDWSDFGEFLGDSFGASVAGAGDVNGDGYADVLVGAPAFASGTSRGAAYVYHGAPTGLSLTPDWTSHGNNEADNLGASVAGAGDLNGDGYADIIVGAPGFPGGSYQGAAVVHYGSEAGLSGSAWLSGENGGDSFGGSVAGAGDVNGDSYADLLVGAPGYETFLFQGKAYLYHGSADSLNSAADWSQQGENGADLLGASVASAGDTNGDGYADVILGAPGYSAGGDSGRAYVYAGNGSGGNGESGRRVLPRQLRGDGSGVQVQPWGLSHGGKRFTVRMWATDPSGRGRVKLQVQACPPGLAFGNPLCSDHVSPAWTDVTATASGVELSETIRVPDAGTLHRWRARVLYAPQHVIEAGITPPPNPAHGPWRRFVGQALEADVRTTWEWESYLPLVLRGSY